MKYILALTALINALTMLIQSLENKSILVQLSVFVLCLSLLTATVGIVLTS
uniref:hypothetical protein n=1 Tax=Vibrio TaxID=662 RepID=UPI00031FDD18|nr:MULTISPECIES: hypothetical protein [Vibrio]